MNLLDAFKMAAAAKEQNEPKTDAPKSAKVTTKQEAKTATKSTAKPKSDTPKTKGGALYVIPKEFKQAIEDHLKGRADMAEKLKQTGKSIDGCCDYIFDVMRKRAEKERNDKSAVGLYADPQEIFGLAVHYYDESEKSLKEELKAK